MKKVKMISEQELDLINDSCCSFIAMHCALNNIESEEEQSAVFDKMYNEDLISIFMKFKENFYPNTEMNEEEYLKYSSKVITETFGTGVIKKFITDHSKTLS